MLSFGVTYADVTLTGLMESAYTFNGADKGISKGKNGGSEFRLGGTEDIGGGLKADFKYVFIQDHNKGGTNGLKNYNSYVGLNGDFGTVRIGQQWTPLDLVSWDNDATGGIDSLSTATQFQAEGSVTYISPTISGFTLTAQGLNESKDYAGFSVKYAVDAFTVSLASQSQQGSKDYTSLGGTYDFGMAKLFVNSVMHKGDKDAFGAGVSVPIGSSTSVALSFSQKDKDKKAQFLGTYNLSKRTSVYFLTKYTDQTSGTATTSSINSIGVQHNF